MENSNISSDFLQPNEEILWQYDFTPPEKKKIKDNGLKFLISTGRIIASIMGIALFFIAFAIALRLYLLFFIPLTILGFIIFKFLKVPPATTPSTNTVDYAGTYVITDLRVLEITASEVLALPYADIYDIDFLNQHEATNTIIFTDKRATTNIEMIDYGQLYYDFFKTPQIVQEAGTEISFQHLPNAQKAMDIAWREWSKKGPFVNIDKTLKELAIDHNLTLSPFKMEGYTPKTTLSGEVDDMEFYLELNGRYPFQEFYIEVLCPNPSSYNLFLSPQHLPTYLETVEPVVQDDREGYLVDIISAEEVRDYSFDGLFEVVSDQANFSKAVLTVENKKLLEETHSFYPGHFHFGDEESLKKLKQSKRLKLPDDESVLDLDLIKAPRTIQKSADYNEGQGTWLTFSCDFSRIPKNVDVPIPELIKAGFKSTVALARSIDGYFE